MLKRSLAAAILVFMAFPAGVLAASWTLQTWVKSAGGTLTSRNLATPQTNVNGSIYRSYTTHASLPVTVTANTGYAITNVTRNGVVVATGGTNYATTVAGFSAQSVYATFGPAPVTITASSGIGGSVTPTSVTGYFYGQKPTVPLRFTFTPITGQTVAAISGVQTGMTVSSPLPAPVNAAVVVTIPTSFTFTANVALSGSFSGPPIANAGTAQTVHPGTLVTLSGSGSPAPITSYSWTQILGPTVVLNGANTATPSFTPTQDGTYRFRLVVENASGVSSPSMVYVFVTSQPSAIARMQCENCHQANGIGASEHVFANWSSSPHNNEANPTLCASCHIGANSGAHPGQGLSTLGSICSNCHTDGQGNVIGHVFQIGTYSCTFCHEPHTTAPSRWPRVPPHFNSITTGAYPASYVTSRAVCADCHTLAAGNDTARHDWAASGHAATTAAPWTAYDFKTLDGCTPCHSTTGFIAYSTGKATSAWGVASDKTKELLTCKGCHSNVSTGLIRPYPALAPYSQDTYENPEAGPSNLCLVCHSGRKSGRTITALLSSGADFTSLPFVDSHAGAAGGTLFGTIGYQFPGRIYGSYSSHSHATVGIGNSRNTGTKGPCVACHKSVTYGHTFDTGATVPLCGNCHTSLTDARISAARSAFESALEVLRVLLAGKGFTYAEAYPHFSATDWGPGPAGANTMGAAFNYHLLHREPGAFAHNPTYTRQLLLDSIDWIDNSVFDDSGAATVALLQTNNGISAGNAAGFSVYENAVNCLGCHTSAAPHFSNISASYAGVSPSKGWKTCGNCHRLHDSTNAVIRSQWSGSLHADPNGTAWKSADFKGMGSDTGRECVRCHTASGFATYAASGFTSTPSFGDPADRAKEVLACRACHLPDFSRRVLPRYSSATLFSFRVDGTNSVTAPITFSDYGNGNVCVPCHSGTTSGEIVRKAAAFAGFTAVGRLMNHYKVGAAIMENAVGYEFSGTPRGTVVDFNKQNTWHAGVGVPNPRVDSGTGGPCTACHMSAADRQHTFRAVRKEANGEIVAVESQPTCGKCHPSVLGGGAIMDAATLKASKSGFTSALAAFKAVLRAKGFDPDAPAGIDWGSSAETRANNMGAYYNYRLLQASDTASYVHNPTYAKRLIIYSIDWLDNSLFDESAYDAITATGIDPATRDAATAWLEVAPGAGGTCILCHEAYYN